MRSYLVNAIIVLIAIFLTGCEYSDLFSTGYEENTEYITSTENEISSENSSITTESVVIDQTTTEMQVIEEAIPEYDYEPYVTVNGNIPYFTDEEKSVDPFETYSDLDSLGRCGVAFANICPELMPTEERGEIGNIRPSGWHTVKYIEEIDGEPLIDGNYLYNRCHLIAYNLAGENDNEKNLITGTRFLNVIGMLPFEQKVAEYVKATENHVLYRVTPVFEGDDMLASGVRMEAWSVEDNGEGICFNVYCFNVQPYVNIDYATGDSRLSEEFEKLKADDSTDIDYVLNTNTMRIHLPDCKSVADIAEHNKVEYHGDMEYLKKMGYKPCGRCLAEYR
ncbi:MAG: DNA/RNA non-specific endonuclease [Lachnospiraceae bacterium]|nr:DNA/RNA non-specific endonuclease [Lachnospiraceae bacterium]